MFTTVVPNTPLIAFDPRARYLEAISDLPGVNVGNFRWMTIRLFTINNSGYITSDKQATPEYIDFLFQNTTQIDRERAQIVIGSDEEGKAYFFDRELRIFTYQGFVYDCAFDDKQKSSGLVGDGYTKFRRLYSEKYRLSQATKNHYIVELRYGDYRILGAMNSMTGTLASDAPTIYSVVFTFWVEGFQVLDSYGITNSIPNTSAVGKISREAAVKLGLGMDYKTDPEPPKIALNAVEDTLNKAILLPFDFLGLSPPVVPKTGEPTKFIGPALPPWMEE